MVEMRTFAQDPPTRMYPHVVSLDRGVEYAIKVNKPEVWSRLAKAQLDGPRIKDAIGMFAYLI